jgi:ATP-dependent protease HslVU (ClpYQ) peptidase subunit
MKNLTCIVGLVDRGTVYIGGDSAASSGTSVCIREDKKVFQNGPFIMGFTNSFRMGQLLHYKFIPPTQEVEDDLEYMSTAFIDNVRNCFSMNGYSFDKTDDVDGGAFLVGYKGVLYVVDTDFQVGLPSTPYYAIGCGTDLALGSLYSTGGKSAEIRIIIALKAASEFSSAVAPPFYCVKQKKPRLRKTK